MCERRRGRGERKEKENEKEVSWGEREQEHLSSIEVQKKLFSNKQEICLRRLLSVWCGGCCCCLSQPALRTLTHRLRAWALLLFPHSLFLSFLNKVANRKRKVFLWRRSFRTSNTKVLNYNNLSLRFPLGTFCFVDDLEPVEILTRKVLEKKTFYCTTHNTYLIEIMHLFATIYKVVVML